MTTAIKPRERSRILKSLKVGVVPNQGAHHYQVGRAKEVKAIIKDLNDLVGGGTCLRFLIGDYGSGKTFLLSLTKGIAHQKNLCVCNADLSPSRRLYSSSGHGRALYAELIKNLSTRQKQTGDALEGVIERFLLKNNLEGNLESKLEKISDFALGFDFITVMKSYKKAFDSGDNELKMASLRWLRGEYTTKTDARQALGVRNIISDNNYYDALKVLSAFIVLAGYKGLLIHLDEMVNILRISQTQIRKNSYEELLKMVNDMMQSNLSNIGIYFSGTPEFLTDDRRGLYTYEALKSRLEENEFTKENLFDEAHPVIRLKPLTSEEIYNLVVRIGEIYDSDIDLRIKSDKKLITSFLQYCNKKLGAQLFTSPRNVIRSYLNLRDALETNKDSSLKKLLNGIEIKPDLNPLLDAPDLSEEDADLKDFSLNS